MNEVWKDISGFENCYQVSNLGNVKSLKRGYRKQERILKPAITKKGYLMVDLRKPQVRKSQMLHRVVLNAFVPNPLNLPQINHIDGNKKNNSVDNLEWCDGFQNMEHAFKTGLKSNPYGEKAANAKLTSEDVVKIKSLLAEQKFTQKEIGQMFGVTKGAIQSINVGRRWGGAL